jgi:hypothetical protein
MLDNKSHLNKNIVIFLMKTKEYYYKYYKDIIESKGGTIISTEYVSAKTPIEYKCNNGHTYKKTATNIKKSWCPKCKVFMKEEICRALFEKMFNKKFIKSKPKWLMGSKGFLLELDGYCEELKIAFEYNGIQHYKAVYTEPALKRTQINDKLKNKICNDKGIHLIVIPYTIQSPKLQQYIIDCCHELNISIPNKSKLDIDTIDIPYKKNLEKLRLYAGQNGGSLLSTSYLGCSQKVEFKCKNNHIFKLTSYRLKNNRWCPTCK